MVLRTPKSLVKWTVRNKLIENTKTIISRNTFVMEFPRSEGLVIRGGARWNCWNVLNPVSLLALFLKQVVHIAKRDFIAISFLSDCCIIMGPWHGGQSVTWIIQMFLYFSHCLQNWNPHTQSRVCNIHFV